MTDIAPPTGTIDITDLVAHMKETWIKLQVKAFKLAANLSPWTEWLNWPVIGALYELGLTIVFTKAANFEENEAFFLNTAIRKGSQADDYVSAKEALENLPPTVSYEEYAHAEKIEMDAFSAFVRATN